MLCINKRDKRTDGRKDGRTNTREAIWPSNFFEVGGIMSQTTYLRTCSTDNSDKPAHSHSLIRNFIGRILNYQGCKFLHADYGDQTAEIHYENMPIHIYRKFHLPNQKKIQTKKLFCFSYFCSKHRLWVLVRTASAQSMFLSRNKKNKVYPCKPQFYYIKVGFKGVNVI